MSRVPPAFRESTIKKHEVNAVWRGVGLILLVLLTIGTFWLAGYVLDKQLLAPYLPFPVPQNFVVTLAKWLPPLPGKPLVQIGTTLLIDIFAYGIIVIAWSIVHPIRPGPTDAKQPRGRGRRSLVR